MLGKPCLPGRPFSPDILVVFLGIALAVSQNDILGREMAAILPALQMLKGGEGPARVATVSPAKHIHERFAVMAQAVLFLEKVFSILLLPAGHNAHRFIYQKPKRHSFRIQQTNEIS